MYYDINSADANLLHKRVFSSSYPVSPSYTEFAVFYNFSAVNEVDSLQRTETRPLPKTKTLLNVSKMGGVWENFPPHSNFPRFP